MTDDLEADMETTAASFGMCRNLDVDARGSDERAAHLDRMWQV